MFTLLVVFIIMFSGSALVGAMFTSASARAFVGGLILGCGMATIPALIGVIAIGSASVFGVAIGVACLVLAALLVFTVTTDAVADVRRAREHAERMLING